MECGHCKAWNRDAAYYCVRCGAALVADSHGTQSTSDAVTGRAVQRQRDLQQAISLRAYSAGAASLGVMWTGFWLLGADPFSMDGLVVAALGALAAVGVCLAVRLAEEKRIARQEGFAAGWITSYALPDRVRIVLMRILKPPRVE